MTTDELIADTLNREGGYVNNPADKGGPTAFGVTAAAWGAYRRLQRHATPEEMQAMTHADAAGFYFAQLQASPFGVLADPLRAQIFDFGVNSGEARATRWLQRTLCVPVTGVMDARTLQAVRASSVLLVNNALVAARIRMYRDIASNDPTQRQFLDGWISRAMSFLAIAPAPTT